MDVVSSASRLIVGSTTCKCLKMITVHHLNNSRSQRVLWMLEELGLKYDVVYHQRDPKTNLAPQSLRRVHPLGKAPILVDDEKTLLESGAILEYLVETYGRGKFKPAPGTPEALRYSFWMHFAEGSAMTPLLLSLIFSRVANPPLPMPLKLIVAPIAKGIADQVRKLLIAPNLKSQQAYMEAELERSTWFAGSEFTAADVQMSFVVEASQARGDVTTSSHPKLSSYLDRIHSRPLYRRALEVGGPYNLLR
jgi:glutathione S-transferase